MFTNQQAGLSSSRAGLISPEQAQGLWWNIAPALREVEGFDELWTTDAVYEAIWNKHMQLWCFGEEHLSLPTLAVISRVVQYPKKKIVEIVWCFGRDFRRHVENGTYLIEQFAEMVGADGIQFQGRAGWTRMLRGHGFRLTGAVYARPIKTREMH